jgi:hypothetical protein
VLGPLLLDESFEVPVVDSARAAVVVGVCRLKLEGDVVAATTKVGGADVIDDELMTVGRPVSESRVESRDADAVCKTSSVVGLDVVWGGTVVVEALSAGARVVKAVPVHPSGVFVVYTVR